MFVGYNFTRYGHLFSDFKTRRPYFQNISLACAVHYLAVVLINKFIAFIISLHKSFHSADVIIIKILSFLLFLTAHCIYFVIKILFIYEINNKLLMFTYPQPQCSVLAVLLNKIQYGREEPF